MRKLFACALCATLAAAAQAVTYTWTNAGGTGSAGNAGSSQLTLCLTATGDLKEGDKVLLTAITLGKRTDHTASDDQAATIKLGAEVSNNTVTSFIAQSQTVDTTGTIMVNASTSTTALKYVFSEGVEIVVGQSYNLALIHSNGNLWVNSGSQNAPFAEVTTSDMVVSRGNGTYAPVYLVEAESIPEPIVPEPTALALLALGVAGLALRRKVA